jgi:hypothetical protein
MTVERAKQVAFAGFAIAFAAAIPAWVHSQGDKASSVWLYLAFLIFGIGFLTAAIGIAVGIASEFEKREKK